MTPPKKKRVLPEGFVKMPVEQLLARIDTALASNEDVMRAIRPRMS